MYVFWIVHILRLESQFCDYEPYTSRPCMKDIDKKTKNFRRRAWVDTFENIVNNNVVYYGKRQRIQSRKILNINTF